MAQFGKIENPTPPWAKWMFRITLLITSVLAFWIAGTAWVSEPNKLEVVLILKAIDLLVFGFSKMFGIPVEDEK